MFLFCHCCSQIRTLRPALARHSLRLIHSGRLLTDGILLLSWLKALEARHNHQHKVMSGGLGASAVEGSLGDGAVADKVYLHCVVGLRAEEGRDADGTRAAEAEEVADVRAFGPGAADEADALLAIQDTTTPAPSRRRGFDSLLEAGLSPSEVANMRQQFYASRGMEVPEDLGEGEPLEDSAICKVPRLNVAARPFAFLRRRTCPRPRRAVD